MNVIIGIAQIQMQKKDLPNEFINALEKIYSSGSSLLGIINDILDMSKIETGKMELNAIEYDVPSLINDAVQLNIVRVGSKPIEFILDIDENLPSKLCGDELRLKQILNNLLSNSIKYTEKGHVKLSVRHTKKKEKTKLHFIIEDTGQGMKPEDIERVFSEYSRFNIEVNRTTEGTGIGLTITQNLVNLMDGTIEVESEYGKGSIFTVTVCQKAVECEAIGHELSQKLRNFTFTGGRQTMRLQILYEPMPYGKILIVDDVETNLYVAEGLMLPYELKIETAISGLKAIEKIESGQTYDIIFMDHMMPLMDGIEATQKLRAMGYGGVVVALTANALAGNDEMFKQKGFDGFIPKPIDARYLDTVLHQYVRGRYPEEAKKYKPFVKEAEVKTLEITPKMLEIFRRDVEKAIKTLQETHANGNIKLFTTTAHAMKSALENIGEKEKAKAALALEEAGIKGDLDYISSYINNFLQTLEQLKKDLIPAESGMDGADIIEDTACLAQQLQVIKNACGAYDDTAAYAALDLLKEKQWKPQTYATLESLRDKLFLHSDFDDAAKQAGELLGSFTQEEKEV
jgi:CheY-like chemotaxis protein/anti-sigma regulatory factor (Ser/Thr protein kinase)/HPt (histidine-containing phosphotransfer) domain-containing protein